MLEIVPLVVLSWEGRRKEEDEGKECSFFFLFLLSPFSYSRGNLPLVRSFFDKLTVCVREPTPLGYSVV